MLKEQVDRLVAFIAEHRLNLMVVLLPQPPPPESYMARFLALGSDCAQCTHAGVDAGLRVIARALDLFRKLGHKHHDVRMFELIRSTLPQGP